MSQIHLQHEISSKQSQLNTCLVEKRSIEEQLEFVQKKKAELKVVL